MTRRAPPGCTGSWTTRAETGSNRPLPRSSTSRTTQHGGAPGGNAKMTVVQFSGGPARTVSITQIQKLCDSVNRVILGKEEKVKIAIATLLARGHLLMEDVPGVGKT